MIEMGENQLKNSDILFKTIYEDSPIGIELYDSNGKLLDLNKSCMELFGVSSKDDVKGFDLLNDPNIPTENITKLKRRETVNYESVFDFELVKDKNLYRTNKSGKIYLDILITPLCAGEEKSISNYLVQIRDITDQKIAERKLIDLNEELDDRIKERTEELRKSEADWRFLVEEAPDIIFTVDRNNRILFINKVPEGITREEAIGTNVLDYVSPEYHGTVENAITKVFQTGEADHYEISARGPKGSISWYSTRLGPIKQEEEVISVILITSDITERKITEKKLKESEKRYRLLAENLNDIITVVNDKGQVEYINKEAHMKVMGYSYNDLMDQSVFDLIHPDDREKTIQAFKNLFKEGEGFTEARIIKKNGDYIWTETNGKTFIDNDGNLKILTITRDITERKKAEYKSRESEEKFRTISDQSLVGIIIAQNGIIKYVNKQMEVLSGYSIEEMKSWKAGEFIKIIHPNYRDLVVEQSTKKQMGLDSVIDQYQFMGIKKSGEYIWVDDYSKTIEYEGSNAVLSIMIDITEKKEAEQKLKDSEENYRTLIDSISDIIFEIDLDGNISYLSPQTINILGYNPEELINKNAFSFIHPDDQEVVLEDQNYVINSGEIVSTEFRLRHKNGHFIIVSSRGQLVEKNNKKNIVGLFRDITERKKTERKLRESEEQYKNLNNELETVLDIIPGMLFCKDRNGVVTRINQGFAESLNLNKEDLIGKTAFDLFPKDQAEAFQMDDLEVISSGTPKLNIEESADFPDGTIYAITNKIPYYNKEGEINGTIGLSVDITERKKIEQELKESEEKFRSITEQSIMGICIVQDDIVKYANHQIADIYGYSIEEIMNWSPYEFLKIIDPEYQEIIKEQARKKQLGHKDVLNHYQFRCIKKTGEKIWVENYSRTINYNGKPADMVTLIDITDKKEAEQKLKDSEEKYRTIIDSITDIIFEIDLDGNISYLSPQTIDILGYKPEELINKNAFRLIHPDDQEVVLKNQNYAINSGEIGSTEFRIRHKDDHFITVSSRGQLVEKDNKKKIVGLFRDITERKKIEETVNQERKRAETYLNLVDVIIVALDRDGNISMLNNKGYKMLEYDEGELLGRNWFENCLPLRDMDNVFEYFNHLMKGEIEVIHFYENPVRTKSGDEKLIAWSTILHRDFKGNIIGLLSSGQDITDRKKAENELKESKQLLETTLYNLQDAIFILDDKIPPKVIECNPALEKIFGYSRNEVIGDTTAFLHVDENSLKAFQNQVLPKLQQSGNVQNFEFRMKRKNGNIFPSEHAISELRNENGATIGIVSLVRDITDRKKAEEKVRDSEKKLRDLIEAVPIGISISTPEGKIIECNSKAYQIYGFNSKKEYLRTPVVDLYSNPSDRERFIELHDRGVVKDFEVEFKRKDGSIFWCSITSIAQKMGYQTTFINLFQDITDRKLAEMKIQQSEEELAAIYNYIPIAIILVDSERRVKKINKFALNFTNRQEGEVIGLHGGEALRCIYSIIDPRGCGFSVHCKTCTIRNIVLETLKSKIPHINVETSLKLLPDAGGGTVNLLVSTVPLNFDGEDRVLVSLIDISDRTKAEQELKESETRYRDLFENSPIALIEQDFSELKSYIDDLIASGINDFEKFIDENPEELSKFSLLINLVDVNKKIVELYNAKNKDDFVERKRKFKKDISKYMTPEALLANKREILSLIKGDTTFESEVVIKTFTDEEIYVYMRTVILPGYENSWSKVIVSFLDLTDRIIAEQKLKESEEKFRTIAEQSALGVIIQQEGLTKFVSPAVSNILEYPIEDINKWTAEDTLKIIHVDDLEQIIEKSVARNEHDYATIINYECRITTKNGNLKWIEVMSKPIKFLDKRAVLISMIDITTKKEVEEELKEVSNLKSELLSRTSHELKTPLVSIKGYVDLLLQVHYDQLDFYTISMLHEIRQGCSRLESLIKDLLETSKLETGAIELKKYKEDLSFLIKFCVKDLQGLANIRKHEILMDFDPNMITMFEKERIYEVIINLLSNAIKYTPPQGIIKIGSKIENNQYIISIEDNGIGFSEEERKKIFKKFGKIERYGKGLDVVSEGSGLGLYISKGIVELHGGQIWAESKGRDKGSTFYFSLPIMDD